jgi:4-alpha-glucanotransferase
MPSYKSNDGETCWAPPQTLAALINALEGKDIADINSLKREQTVNLLRNYRRKRIECCIPEICPAFNGSFVLSPVWLPEKPADTEIVLTIKTEQGETIRKTWKVSELKFLKRNFKGIGTFYRTALTCVKIPYGYHELELEYEGQTIGSSFIISAPEQMVQTSRSWGAFAPVYALRSESDWGIGSLAELKEVLEFVKKQGGKFVGILPILAGFMDGLHANPSPYSPISRLFWNEIYLDMDDLPGVTLPALEKYDKKQIKKLRKQRLVDYGKVYALKQKFLLKASGEFFKNGGEQQKEFQDFVSKYPGIYDYAEFRSMQERVAERKDFRNYHLYVQYAMHSQLGKLRKMVEADEIADLYLDYPVGVHNDGFDACRMSHLLIPGFNIGAPPDDFSDKGQDWGFMPLHPWHIMSDRFKYFRDSLHNYFRYARIIRLDHIMGFYRIFCVPHGGTALEGAYIHYNFEAFLAVLCLESWKNGGILIGEDLGTVPSAVRQAMQRHGMLRMWLFQFYLDSDPQKTFRSVPEMCLAALNTHDMFPFGGFLKYRDIKALEAAGVLGKDKAKRLIRERKNILRGWKAKKNPFIFVMRNMAASSARFLLVTLEDLWRETKPQNMPGTTGQYPNWRRKFRKPLKVWMNDGNVIKTLKIINQHRKTRK